MEWTLDVLAEIVENLCMVDVPRAELADILDKK